MKEIQDIISKYKNINIEESLDTLEKIKAFSLIFYKDVVEIYDIITRIKNPQRNPSGFDLNDAPILGLLVRIWKLLKEIVSYYEMNNAQMASFLDRPIIESAIYAEYLLKSDSTVIEDYRKCSYKDRLSTLTSIENNDFFKTKPGIRLKRNIEFKMISEGLNLNSFDTQKKNKWKVSGKTFRDIFSEIEPDEFYKYLYGFGSEAIHGSWGDSMDFDLVRNDDGTFDAYGLYQPSDIRYVTSVIRVTTSPYSLWIKRIDIDDPYLDLALQWINQVNTKVYSAFDKYFDDII